MEIPVRVLKVERKFEKKYEQEDFEKKSEFEKKLVLKETEKCIVPTTSYSSKWVHPIELEEELIRQQPLHYNDVLDRVQVKLNKEERVVVLKIRNTPYKRYVNVPQYVNVHSLKVKYSVEKKVLLLKAPRIITSISNTLNTLEELNEVEQRRSIWQLPSNKYNLISIPILLKEKKTCVCKQTIKEKKCYLCSKPRDILLEKSVKKIEKIEKVDKFSRTIQLKKEELEEIVLQQQKQYTLTTERKQIIIAKVCPILRVVVVKLRPNSIYNTTLVPFKRIFRLPSQVDIEQVEVNLCQERRAILIKAPFQQRIIISTEKELFERRSQLQQLEKEPEYELSMYKVLKQLRRQLPIISSERNIVILPRFIRSRKTGEHVLHLDVESTRISPDNLLVQLKKCVKVLTIRHPYRDAELYHQLTLPTIVDVERMETKIVDRRILRVKLPIITRIPSFYKY